MLELTFAFRRFGMGAGLELTQTAKARARRRQYGRALTIYSGPRLGIRQTTLKITPHRLFDPIGAPAEDFEPMGVLTEPELLPVLATPRGALFNEDCLTLLRAMKSESVDTAFADPPFNIGKEYGSRVNDSLLDGEYVEWGREWIRECVRTLRPGGAFFLYNLPKWNVIFGSYLVELGMDFRHWIAISVKFGLPIQGRLYPAHYSLLYYTKGKPRIIGKIRTPIETCRHCKREIKDYGGHRGAMNPNGVNLTDVWTDIPPVRHWKFKSKKRSANQLSTKLLERVVHISTEPGDLILDPFGGSGTTFVVAESLGRRWIGSEIESCDVIFERFQSDDLHHHLSGDFVESRAA